MSEDTLLGEDPLAESYQEIAACCQRLGLEVTRFRPVLEPNGYLTVRLTGLSRKWLVRVRCSDLSPTSLPSVRLLENTELLAHVGYNGLICVNDAQGLSLDLNRPADIIAFTLVEAMNLLERAEADARSDQSEFFNELEGYWIGLPGAVIAQSAVDPGPDREVFAYKKGKGAEAQWFFAENSTPPPASFMLTGVPVLQSALFEVPTCISPPAPSEKLGLEFVTKVVNSFNRAQLKIWEGLLRRSSKSLRDIAVLLAFPRRDGGSSLIGLVVQAYNSQLVNAGGLTPLSVVRHSPQYMRQRGGASQSLLAKHIVVFGVGAVGAHVADTLASCGVGRLTLVDPDKMSPDNVFRHVLEPMWSGVHKVSALKVELERKYPGLKVAGHPISAEDWLNSEALAGVDGVVLALGLPTLERVLSKKLRASVEDIPLVFTWLEPLDLGGHSVLVRTKEEGCLDCLYRNDEGEATLSAQTAFLAAGQKVSRNLTGCGSVFVPYGALQARKTALLCAEQVLEALAGGTAPKYKFWVGPGTEATAHGLKTTNWWTIATTTTSTEATQMLFGQPCLSCRVRT